MVSLCLEGGGARGAYQAGVITALYEYGYKFDAVTGTSIGALNAVMVAQYRFDEAYKMWESMRFNNVFDFDSNIAEDLARGDFGNGNFKILVQAIRKAVANKGLDTSKVRSIIKSFIDEEALRSSDIDFGVMTVSLNELKPCPIYIDDIPQGKVCDYVMASANFPGFEKVQIDGNTYIDGGTYDNLPLNMLVDRGHNDIVAIETLSFLTKRPIRKGSRAEVLYIKPSEKPGRMLEFNNESVLRAIKVGKFDALRALHGYAGEKYFVEPTSITPFGFGLLDLTECTYITIAKMLDCKAKQSDKTQSINYIIASVNKERKAHYKTIDSALWTFIETVADEVNIERLEIYKYEDLLEDIQARIKDAAIKTSAMLIFEIIFKDIRVTNYEKAGRQPT